MIRCDFVYGHDSEFGMDGWIPKDNPTFNASAGLGVAHDAMEHFDLKAGTLEEEILAFGSIFYIRVVGGYFHNYTRSALTPADQLSGDLSRFAVDHFWRTNKGRVLSDPGIRPRHIDGWEDELEETAVETIAQIRSDLDDAEYREFRRANPDFKALLKRWIRRGYAMCAKKYQRVEPHRLSDTFADIERSVEEIKYAEHGDELSVTIRIKNGWPQQKLEHRRLEDMYEDDY